MDYRRRRPLTASDCSDSNTKLDGCLKLRTLNWRYFICLLVTPVVQHCAVLVHPLKVKHRRFLRIYSQLHSYSAGTLILAGYHSSKIIYLKNDINCDIFITTPRFKVVTYTTIFSHSARKCLRLRPSSIMSRSLFTLTFNFFTMQARISACGIYIQGNIFCAGAL